MMKKIYVSLCLATLLNGCGGGAAPTAIENASQTQSTNVDQSTSSVNSITTIPQTQQTQITTIDPKDINLTKDISEGKISDYHQDDPIEVQYLSVVNYLRSLKIKCNDSQAVVGPAATRLQWNTLLKNAAKEHSDDMFNSGHYGHPGSGTVSDKTGQTLNPVRASMPSERLTYNGYDYNSAGENIAMKASTLALSSDTWIEIMEAWIKSDEGHCSNIMNSNYVDFGMVESRGTANITYDDNVTRESSVAYWTQEFGNQ